MLLQGEVAVEPVLRRNGKGYETVTEGVAVASVAVFENRDGVGQSSAPLELTFEVVVGLGQVVAHLAVLVEGVRSEEWSLGQCEEPWRGDDRAEGVERCSVVAQRAVDVAVGSVEPYIKLVGDGDVAVQSHVEARVVVLLQRGVAQRITY